MTTSYGAASQGWTSEQADSVVGSLQPRPHQQHTRRTVRSVQAHYVAAREIVEDVLCLTPLGSTGEAAVTRERRNRLRLQREYRAILEVTSVNYVLKAESEQDAITVSYQAFLNALTFPVQVLVRVVRLDLAPYLARLETTAAQHEMTGDGARLGDAGLDPGDERADGHSDVAGRSANNASRASTPSTPPAATVWQRLALDHVNFVRDLAARRTLLERRFYLIVPPDGETASGIRSRQAPASLGNAQLSRLVPGHRRRVRRAASEELANARQHLDLRTGELVRQLGRMGLEARRLQGPELASLYYSCVTPARAARHPLPSSVVAGADQPVHAGRSARTHAEILTTKCPGVADSSAAPAEGGQQR